MKTAGVARPVDCNVGAAAATYEVEGTVVTEWMAVLLRSSTIAYVGN